MFGIKSSPYLLSLAPGEVFRLPQSSRSVQVLSGTAWLTVAGEDIILTSNEVASLLPLQNVALISALSEQPLLLKVLDRHSKVSAPVRSTGGTPAHDWLRRRLRLLL